MKTRFFLVFILVFAFLNCNMQTSKHIKIIEPNIYKKEISLKKVQLIDVRTPEEYNRGTILYAKNIDYESSSFENKIQNLDKTKPVYIFCAKGGRSQKAAKLFEKAGFKEIIDLKGGYDNWK